MDTDIKIFGENEPRHCDDLDHVAAQTEALREEGSLGQAKRLGRELAGLSVGNAQLLSVAEGLGLARGAAWEQQLQVLMVFSAQQALRALEPQLLAEAAITAMNNYLINRAREFWDTISDGSAFTQYLLAVRDVPEAQPGLIGEVFARVCGQEDNADLHKLGATVFTTAHELVAAKTPHL